MFAFAAGWAYIVGDRRGFLSPIVVEGDCRESLQFALGKRGN